MPYYPFFNYVRSNNLHHQRRHSNLPRQRRRASRRLVNAIVILFLLHYKKFIAEKIGIFPIEICFTLKSFKNS
jgi:hypothetical protein